MGNKQSKPRSSKYKKPLLPLKTPRPRHLQGVLTLIGPSLGGELPRHAVIYTDPNDPPPFSPDTPAILVHAIDPPSQPHIRIESVREVLELCTPILPPSNAGKSPLPTDEVATVYESFKQFFPHGIRLSLSDRKTGKVGRSYRHGQLYEKLTDLSMTKSVDIEDPVARRRVHQIIAEYTIGRDAMVRAVDNSVGDEIEQYLFNIANPVIRDSTLYKPVNFPPELEDQLPQQYFSSPGLWPYPLVDPSSESIATTIGPESSCPHEGLKSPLVSSVDQGDQPIEPTLEDTGPESSPSQTPQTSMKMGVFVETKSNVNLETKLFTSFHYLLECNNKEDRAIYLDIRTVHNEPKTTSKTPPETRPVFVQKLPSGDRVLSSYRRFPLAIFQFFCQFHSLQVPFGIVHNHTATLMGHLSNRDVLEFSEVYGPYNTSTRHYNLLSAVVDLATEWDLIEADRFERGLADGCGQKRPSGRVSGHSFKRSDGESTDALSSALASLALAPAIELYDYEYIGRGRIWTTYKARCDVNGQSIPVAVKRLTYNTWRDIDDYDEGLSYEETRQHALHELALYDNALLPLQGCVVPRVYRKEISDDKIIVVMELADGLVGDPKREWHDLRISEKRTILSHYAALHMAGVEHGDVELRHVRRIGPDRPGAELRIIDFDKAEQMPPPSGEEPIKREEPDEKVIEANVWIAGLIESEFYDVFSRMIN